MSDKLIERIDRSLKHFKGLYPDPSFLVLEELVMTTLQDCKQRIEELEADKAELAEEAGDGLYQAEYDGRMEELCYFCGKLQEDGEPPHEEGCIIVKHTPPEGEANE